MLWAQRKDKLYLTIDVQDVASPKVDLTNDGGHGKLSFRGSAGGNDYALDVTFNKEINPEESKISATARHIFMVVAKSGSGPYWPRLTKDSSKGDTHIKCDWDKVRRTAGGSGARAAGSGRHGAHAPIARRCARRGAHAAVSPLATSSRPLLPPPERRAAVA